MPDVGGAGPHAPTGPGGSGIEDGYDGPAVLALAGAKIDVRVRLAGRFEPVDGRTHWYGRIAPDGTVAAAARSGRVEAVLTVGAVSVPVRLRDVDPWGGVRIHGVGGVPEEAA